MKIGVKEKEEDKSTQHSPFGEQCHPHSGTATTQLRRVHRRQDGWDSAARGRSGYSWASIAPDPQFFCSWNTSVPRGGPLLQMT